MARVWNWFDLYISNGKNCSPHGLTNSEFRICNLESQAHEITKDILKNCHFEVVLTTKNGQLISKGRNPYKNFIGFLAHLKTPKWYILQNQLTFNYLNDLSSYLSIQCSFLAIRWVGPGWVNSVLSFLAFSFFLMYASSPLGSPSLMYCSACF